MAIFVCLHGDKLRWHLSQKLALMSVSKVYHQKRNDKGDHLTGKVGSLVASRVVDGDASQWQVRSITQLYYVGSTLSVISVKTIVLLAHNKGLCLMFLMVSCPGTYYAPSITHLTVLISLKLQKQCKS